MKHVLVTYATKHGATGEIAERIAAELRQNDLQVDFLPVTDVQDLEKYDAIILGSAVYAGQWRKEAALFLEAREHQLARRPLWLFSSGPTGEGDPVALMEGWVLPPGLQSVVERIAPQEITVFGGFIDRDTLNLGEKLIIKAVKAPVGDYRNWDAIADWATEIAHTLHAVQTAL